jgi:hypothetical protein
MALPFPNPFAGQTTATQPAAPPLPPTPWGQNQAVTGAAFALLGSPNLRSGLKNAAPMAMAGMAGNNSNRQLMMAQQEKQTEQAAIADQRLALNAGLKLMSKLPVTPEEQAAIDRNPEVALKIRELSKPPELPNSVQEYQYGKQDPAYNEWATNQKAAGATKFTIDGQKYGTIPPGWMIEETPTGVRMVPIPEGPEDPSVKNAARQDTKEVKGDIVLDDIDRALAEVQSNPDATTGLAGGLMSGLPIPSPAKRVSGFLNGIKSNISIDNLQLMREQSPTGGALGNVSDKDLAILQGVYGDLSQSTDAPTFEYNLKRLRNTYLDIIHGRGNGPEREDITAPRPMNESGGGGGGGDYPPGTEIEHDDGMRMIMGTDGQWRPKPGA